MGKTKIEKEDKYIGNTQEVFSASFELTFSHNVTESETIAYIFGLSAVSGNPFEDCWAYEMGKNGGKIVKYNESGDKATLTSREAISEAFIGGQITEQEADDLMQKIGITKNAVEDATVEAEVNLFDTKSAKR